MKEKERGREEGRKGGREGESPYPFLVRRSNTLSPTAAVINSHIVLITAIAFSQVLPPAPRSRAPAYCPPLPAAFRLIAAFRQVAIAFSQVPPPATRQARSPRLFRRVRDGRRPPAPFRPEQYGRLLRRGGRRRPAPFRRMKSPIVAGRRRSRLVRGGRPLLQGECGAAVRCAPLRHGRALRAGGLFARPCSLWRGPRPVQGRGPLLRRPVAQSEDRYGPALLRGPARLPAPTHGACR